MMGSQAQMIICLAVLVAVLAAAIALKFVTGRRAEPASRDPAARQGKLLFVMAVLIAAALAMVAMLLTRTP